MSEETFGANLATILQAASDSEIAGALTRNFDWLISLPPLQTAGSFPRPMLPPLGALGIFLGMRALMRSGQASEAWPFLEEAVAAYVSRHTTSGHRPYARQAVLRDALSDYDNLRIVTVEALMATGQTTEAAGALLGLTREVTHPQTLCAEPRVDHAGRGDMPLLSLLLLRRRAFAGEKDRVRKLSIRSLAGSP